MTDTLNCAANEAVMVQGNTRGDGPICVDKSVADTDGTQLSCDARRGQVSKDSSTPRKGGLACSKPVHFASAVLLGRPLLRGRCVRRGPRRHRRVLPDLPVLSVPPRPGRRPHRCPGLVRAPTASACYPTMSSPTLPFLPPRLPSYRPQKALNPSLRKVFDRCAFGGVRIEPAGCCLRRRGRANSEQFSELAFFSDEGERITTAAEQMDIDSGADGSQSMVRANP